jgi:hypothetical protein
MAKLVLDMSKEKGYLNDLLPEGNQLVRILDAKQAKIADESDFIVTTIMSVKTGAQTKSWLPLEEGKRRVLKSLLDATGLYENDEHGNYVVDPAKLIGAEVGAFIISEDSTYTTKDGHEATRKKSKVKKFIKKEELEKMNEKGDALEPAPF